MIGPVVKIDPASLRRRATSTTSGGKTIGPPCLRVGLGCCNYAFCAQQGNALHKPHQNTGIPCGGPSGCVDAHSRRGSTIWRLPGVLIADGAKAFVAACERALELGKDRSAWLPKVDLLLARSSWDETFRQMSLLVEEAVRGKVAAPPVKLHRPAIKGLGDAPAFDYTIVGAGFAGSVLAERLASAGKRILICDRRSHIGGNAYDFHDEAGILVHRYGPHIFHTNSEEIFGYLSRFTKWRPYQHRVLASVADKLLPVPINRTTLNGLYGLDLSTDEAAAAFLSGRAEPVTEIRTSRDVVISQVGTDLYRTFFEGYTRKQWGLDPADLDKSVTARIPTRTSTDDRYFLDTYQAMPADGFTHLFENMLDHPNIRIEVGVEY